MVVPVEYIKSEYKKTGDKLSTMIGNGVLAENYHSLVVENLGHTRIKKYFVKTSNKGHSFSSFDTHLFQKRLR